VPSDPLGADSRHRIDLYASDDLGRTWRPLCRPVDDTGFGGNPATLTPLPDGRLCLACGYRGRPFGIRARLSEDDEVTWGAEIVLRGDAGCHDLGYPRTVVRPDGTVVTAYYCNDGPTAERCSPPRSGRPEQPPTSDVRRPTVGRPTSDVRPSTPTARPRFRPGVAGERGKRDMIYGVCYIS